MGIVVRGHHDRAFLAKAICVCGKSEIEDNNKHNTYNEL